MLLVVSFLLGLLIGIAGAVLMILWFTIPRLEQLYVFRPSKDIFKTPEHFGINSDQCFIETEDGCRLSAWHMRPPKPCGSVIYFHGNNGNLGILNELFQLFFHHGLQVFAVDYRGYGWSTGVPTEKGIQKDAVAAVEYFNSNFKKDSVPTIIWGRSLGGVPASFAAGKIPPNGLILETTFADKISLLEDFSHFRFFQYFSRYKLETAAYLKERSFPVLVIHGDKDKTIPLKQGQILYNRLSEPKEFWRVAGAGHIDIHMIDTEAYINRILSFVESVKPPVIH